MVIDVQMGSCFTDSKAALFWIIPAQVTEKLAMPEDCMIELKAQNTSSHTLLVATEKLGIGQVIDCARYSKLQKLLRVTALVRKINPWMTSVLANYHQWLFENHKIECVEVLREYAVQEAEFHTM